MPFRDITGHTHLLDLIARAATRGTLPPSLIFAGPEGVGKRMAAVALAQIMNCRPRLRCGSDTAAIDAGCVRGVPSCKRIARGVHADVLLHRAWRHRVRSRSIRCATRSSGPPIGRSRAAAGSSFWTMPTR